MSYINREDLLARLQKVDMDRNHHFMAAVQMGVDHAIQCVKEAPAADVVEVRHGKLKNGGNGVYDTCAACESEIYLATKMNYCPICGVKWDKEDADEI